MEMEEALEKIGELHCKELDVNRIDDYSVLVTKIRNGEICALSEDEESKLRERFNFVTPWHKEYGLRFFRRYELFGIPLHLWTDANIRKISGNLGIVE